MTYQRDLLNKAVASMEAKSELLRKDKEVIEALQKLSGTDSFTSALDVSTYGASLAQIRSMITGYLELVDNTYKEKHIDRDALNIYNARAPSMWAWLTALENRLMLMMSTSAMQELQNDLKEYVK